MQITLLSVFILIFSTSSFANCCICQTDTSPEEHIKWYKTGCKMWLLSKGCPMGEVISQDDNIKDHIPKSCEGKKLKLGYVGHWSSSNQTVNYIKKIMDVINEKQLSLQYENTACRAIDNPQAIKDYLSEIKPGLNGREVSISGNQAISTGMWDPILPGKHNINSTVTTSSDSIAYPSCRKLVDKGCWAMFQEGETGICEEEDSSKSIIKCTRDAKVEYRARVKSAGGKSYRNVTKEKVASVWKRVEVNKKDFTIFGGGEFTTLRVNRLNPITGFEESHGFDSVDERSSFLEKLKAVEYSSDSLKNIKFEIEEDYFENYDFEIVDGKKKETITKDFYYIVKYVDPFIPEGVFRKRGHEFSTKKEAQDYIKGIKEKKLLSKDEIDKSISTEDKTVNHMATVYNSEIDFRKSFKNGDEAKAYLEKINNTDNKGLKDIVYCNYLGK